MIVELHRNEFYRCKNIINENGQLEVKAVVHGMNPGRIFVDNRESPTSGIVWLGDNDGFLFIGEEKNEEFNKQLNSFIDNFIKIEAHKVGLYYFEAIGNHDGWNDMIERCFKHRQLKSWDQKVYTATKKELPPLKVSYRVTKITKELLCSEEITNVDFLHTKILESWLSLYTFLEQGIGYCIIQENEIVTACISRFVVGNEHAIAIETLKSYQGKRYGEQVAFAFVHTCLELGLIPYWDCMEDNIPSVKLAEKLKLQNSYNYKGYYFAI